MPETPVELVSTGPFIYYENYVTSFDYVPADLGEVPESRFRGTTSCGAEVLGSIDGETFREVEASELSCGFFQEDLQDYYIMNSTRKGVLFTSGFYRRLSDQPLQDLKLGDKLTVRGGFNIFDTKDDEFRSYFGYGNEIEVQFGEVAEDAAHFTTFGFFSMALLSFLAF